MHRSFTSRGVPPLSPGQAKDHYLRRQRPRTPASTTSMQKVANPIAKPPVRTNSMAWRI